MKNLFTLLFSFVCFFAFLEAQTAPPKREFRAAWVASVVNIDWPSSKNLSSSTQKSEVDSILNRHHASNINAILLQVRPACDAFYQGGYEPLSEWLVGVQGGNLSQYYDPLQYWVDETHKRGMELHVWINPYRSVHSASSSVHSSHISKTQPTWNINYGGSPYKFLDPGLPQVRDYVVKVVMDIVRRYNIDGVHYDDYFYPYGGMNNQDSVSWGLYGGGFSNKGDWRRNNVNTFVAQLYDSIKAVKSWVKYGVSPFGIWRPNNPPGISGLDAYAVIYCDALNWITNKKVDYLTPQLYWVIGGSQDYSKLMPWWASYTKLYGRHLYPGHGAHNLSTWPASEIQNQIELNRLPNTAQGSVFFSSRWLTNNAKGIQDSLRNNQYRYHALPPPMPWLDSVPPLPPLNLAGTVNANTVQLQWQKGADAVDGDSAVRYVIYSAVNSLTEVDLSDPKNIRCVSADGMKEYLDPVVTPSAVQYQAVVTSCDKLWNESDGTAKVYTAPAGKPFLSLKEISVDFGDVAIGDTFSDTTVVYNRSQNALMLDSVFTGSDVFSVVPSSVSVSDSVAIAISFSPTSFGVMQDTMYVENNSVLGTVKVALKGQSPQPMMKVSTSIVFGSVYIGDTLGKTFLITNTSFNDVMIDSVRFVASSKGKFQSMVSSLPVSVANGDTVKFNIAFNPDTVSVFFDTLVVYGNAQNSPAKVILFGIGQMPMSVDPNTGLAPAVYALNQNFPNPFNPTTAIRFSLLSSHYTTLKIYDMLGREVATIVDGTLESGQHTYQFSGENLSSGVYLYRLVSGSYNETKKMILQK